MIYVDSSVVLATLLAADRIAPPSFWQQTLVSSRLLTIEVWVGLHRHGAAASHADPAGALLGRIGLLEMDARVLHRALEPFPAPVRTLDAIHLASAVFLQRQGQPLRLATFDDRMAAAAAKLRLELADAGGEGPT
jgi:hypothetical protein